jgi:hypothetical protein
MNVSFIAAHESILRPKMGAANCSAWDGNPTIAALLVSERSHAVGAGQVRLRRLRGVGPFSGVLEMRGMEEGGQVAVRRARKHPNVAPVTKRGRSTLVVDIYGP